MSGAIIKSENICGGDARIEGTRIPVWTLECLRRLGLSDAEILNQYPTLVSTDLVNAWEYAASHCDEMDRAILENTI